MFGMRAALIVEHEVLADAGPRIADAVIGMQIDLLVLDRLPEPLDEDVVSPAPFTIHADADAARLERASELQTGELAALVGVEDLGLAIAGKGFFQCLDAKRRTHADRYAPGEYPPARPVHDGCQIDKPAGHRHVGDVHRPNVIRALDRQVPQQVRVDRVRRMPPAGVGLLVHRHDVHCAHQRRDVLATNEVAFAFEQVAHHTAAGEGVLEVQLIDTAHQGQILARCGPRKVVDR